MSPLVAEIIDPAEAPGIVDRFLHHARHEAGLLAERGLGQFGFFHLTFEEYLAARQMARQRVEGRRRMLRDHWEDPRWSEVILLLGWRKGGWLAVAQVACPGFHEERPGNRTGILAPSPLRQGAPRLPGSWCFLVRTTTSAFVWSPTAFSSRPAMPCVDTTQAEAEKRRRDLPPAGAR